MFLGLGCMSVCFGRRGGVGGARAGTAPNRQVVRTWRLIRQGHSLCTGRSGWFGLADHPHRAVRLNC